ncbi:hypothetical protein RHMOL_Rhmol13G0258500 [Rhododendron molle]|uniref:Uncharacterized protein n=1 Tax=Rhododendron molle TaxID=49168 RepID=A0ACC0LC25_RHOML|nr:hypothetical protein RHMOL_Rhmol13G0258500 [Rhododendron molle]
MRIGANNEVFIAISNYDVAALNWVLKDGLGRLSRCIYTASLASALDTNLKRVRFSTSVLFSSSIGVESLTPAFPQYFLILATIANIAKQMSLACHLATGGGYCFGGILRAATLCIYCQRRGCQYARWTQHASAHYTKFRSSYEKSIASATGDAIVDDMLETAAASKMRATEIMKNEDRFSISKCIKVMDGMQIVDQRLYYYA